jgi:hypothetical protein
LRTTPSNDFDALWWVHGPSPNRSTRGGRNLKILHAYRYTCHALRSLALVPATRCNCHVLQPLALVPRRWCSHRALSYGPDPLRWLLEPAVPFHIFVEKFENLLPHKGQKLTAPETQANSACAGLVTGSCGDRCVLAAVNETVFTIYRGGRRVRVSAVGARQSGQDSRRRPSDTGRRD